MPEAEQGMNVARNIGALSRTYQIRHLLLQSTVSVHQVLQSIAYAAERIMLGHSEAIIAGGVESMSMVPMMGNTIRPNCTLS